jgi:DNA-binding transcriptional LysR family regulator
VRIGAGPTFSSYMLPLLLEDFRKRCPDIEVIVEAGHTTQFQDELDRGALDVAFLVVDQPLPSHVVLEASWEFEIPLVVGAQRACPRRCFLRRLKDQPFILYRQGSLFEGVIDRYFNSFGFQPRVTMRLDNADPIKAMIRSGFGISLLPSWVVTRELREGSIELIRQREQPLKSRIGMMRRRSAYVPHSVRAFLDLARKWDWPWG